MFVKPINNFVILKLDPAEKMVGKLFTAAAGNDKFAIPQRIGTVKGVGRGLITAGGVLIPPQVKVGDRVLILENQKLDNKIDHDGEECYYLQDEGPIIGIITQESSLLA